MLLSITGAYALNGKCRVLAIAGGTQRGAYEAGVIIGLINNLPAGEAQYDVVTGVGVGAINGLIVSSFPQGQEAQAAAKLNSYWTSFTSSTFYKEWIGGLITGLTVESGLFDSSALQKSIKSLTPTKFQRWFGVGATDLLSGSYVWFNSSSQTVANMETGVYASATDPGFFPIVTYNKLQLVSGHVKFAIDLLHAVNACMFNLGYSEDQIIVHAVMGGGLKISQVDAINYKTLQVTARYFEIAAFDSFMQVIENAQHDFPTINIQYTIYPSSNVTHVLYPYDYTKAELVAQLNLGEQDAIKAINSTFSSQ